MTYVYIAVSDSFAEYAHLALASIRKYCDDCIMIYDMYRGDAVNVNGWRTARMRNILPMLPENALLVKIDADMLFSGDICELERFGGDVLVTARQYNCKYSINAGLYAVRNNNNGNNFLSDFCHYIEQEKKRVWFSDQDFLCKIWDECKYGYVVNVGPMWNWTIEKNRLSDKDIPQGVRVLHFNREDKSEMKLWTE